MDSHRAPEPPTRRSLLWVGLSLGAAVSSWIVVLLSQLNPYLPAARQIAYMGSAVLLSGAATALTAQYVVRRARRDAWWNGFASGDEPLADVVPLRRADGASQKTSSHGASPAK